MGVDLACYGGEYVGGPNSTGWVQGCRDLIEALALHTFIGAEAGQRSIGRGYKLDRQEVVTLVVAFMHWLEMDHEKERFEPAWERAHYIEKGIKDLPGLKSASFSYIPPSGEGYAYHTLGLQLTFKKSEKEGFKMVRSLREEDPEIWVR